MKRSGYFYAIAALIIAGLLSPVAIPVGRSFNHFTPHSICIVDWHVHRRWRYWHNHQVRQQGLGATIRAKTLISDSTFI